MIPRSAVLSWDGHSIRFSNAETPGESVEAIITDLEGWFGGVGVSDPADQRKLGHGLFPLPSLRTGRELTLSATLIFREEVDRAVADRFISGILWDGSFGTLEATVGNVTLTSAVKLSGAVKHTYSGTESVHIQLPLTAPDPFLYGPARTYQIFSAGAGQGLAYPLFGASTGTSSALDWGSSAPLGGAATNSGNTTAWPIFTIHGDWPSGFRITSGAQAIEYPSPVHASSPVTVENLTGSVKVAGIDQTYRLTRRDWMNIPAGESIQPRIEPLGPATGGWCDITVKDTYI